MKKNYFEKIVKYAKKVFNIERSLRQLSDGRKNPKHKTNEVVLIVLIGFLLRTRSFNNLNNMIKDDDFKNILPRGTKLPKVDMPLSFVKFLMKKPDGKRSQIMIITTKLNMELVTLFKIIRSRQDIENSIFHNLKTECGLEHCFVHGGNAIEAVLCLMFIASNFVQLFYHRRIKKSVKTQVELFRLLLKGLYLLKRKAELIFNTG